jgi:hypothetical protein
MRQGCPYSKLRVSEMIRNVVVTLKSPCFMENFGISCCLGDINLSETKVLRSVSTLKTMCC